MKYIGQEHINVLNTMFCGYTGITTGFNYIQYIGNITQHYVRESISSGATVLLLDTNGEVTCGPSVTVTDCGLHTKAHSMITSTTHKSELEVLMNYADGLTTTKPDADFTISNPDLCVIESPVLFICSTPAGPRQVVIYVCERRSNSEIAIIPVAYTSDGDLGSEVSKVYGDGTATKDLTFISLVDMDKSTMEDATIESVMMISYANLLARLEATDHMERNVAYYLDPPVTGNNITQQMLDDKKLEYFNLVNHSSTLPASIFENIYWR